MTVDAQAEVSRAIRECARRYKKTNFFVSGEITSGNNLGAVYIGRGRRPDMTPSSINRAIAIAPEDLATSRYFLRANDLQALDSGAFHYSIYRYLTRFLGMGGNLEAGFDLPLDWVETW